MVAGSACLVGGGGCGGRVARGLLLHGGGVSMNKEQDVIEAAKEVDKVWRDEGPHSMRLSICLGLLNRSLSKLHKFRYGGNNDETIQPVPTMSARRHY